MKIYLLSLILFIPAIYFGQDLNQQINDLIDQGRAYEKQRAFDDAISSFTKCMELNKQIENASVEAYCNSAIGDQYIESS